MAGFAVNVNKGMVAAAVILVIGAILILVPEDPRLHDVGIGVVLAAGVVYLVARSWMIYRSYRRR